MKKNYKIEKYQKIQKNHKLINQLINELSKFLIDTPLKCFGQIRDPRFVACGIWIQR